MWKRNFFILAILSLAFVGTAQAQWHPDFDAKIEAINKKPRVKTKPKTVTTAHDRYANQEVSYRKSAGNEVAVESLDKTKPKGTGKRARQVVFEPNNEPLWAKAKQTPTAKTRNARARKNGVVVVEVPVNSVRNKSKQQPFDKSYLPPNAKAPKRNRSAHQQ